MDGVLSFKLSIKEKLEKFEVTTYIPLKRNNNGEIQSPKSSNKILAFDELTKYFTIAVNSFDITLLSGNFSINILSNGLETSKYLKKFTDTFSLTSLIYTATCTKSVYGTVIIIILTNL